MRTTYDAYFKTTYSAAAMAMAAATESNAEIFVAAM